jgi:hypothetical protein
MAGGGVAQIGEMTADRTLKKHPNGFALAPLLLRHFGTIVEPNSQSLLKARGGAKTPAHRNI